MLDQRAAEDLEKKRQVQRNATREGKQEKANVTEKRRSPPVYTPIAVSRRARYSVVVLVPVIGLFALPFAVSVSILRAGGFFFGATAVPVPRRREPGGSPGPPFISFLFRLRRAVVSYVTLIVKRKKKTSIGDVVWGGCTDVEERFVSLEPRVGASVT